ncbi:DNA -binding domain-containing protein [Caulobacter sp. Root1455]|uniref:DNA -binding domain-containing protein n=1 Tax=Caulobacter sp. Root1455 TaxID=1736465 RepID=UPI0009E9E606|nr:DUF2285 domain-containing protein [Caulobacter sp. Root1455]
MSDVRALAPVWRQAETYEPLLGADASVWAWEFARRGRGRDAGLDGADPGEIAPELCFAGPGPAGDPLPAVLWRWQADGSVPVLRAQPATPGDAAALDLARLDLPCLVVRTADGEQHVQISQGLARLRLALVGGDILAGPAILHFHLPDAGRGGAALAAVAKLIALRDTGRLPPRPRALSKAGRWLEVLRAHDARQAGASQRDIALALFGEERVRQDWSGPSDYMRMRVQRLVRAAEEAVGGGYRRVFGLRAAETGRAPVVDIWRSPAWRGGFSSLVLAVAIFLGTSFGPTQTRRESCRFSGDPCLKTVERSRIVALAGFTRHNSRAQLAPDDDADSGHAS